MTPDHASETCDCPLCGKVREAWSDRDDARAEIERVRQLCGERTRARDEARQELERLNQVNASLSEELQRLYQREGRSLDDWKSLRADHAELERLRQALTKRYGNKMCEGRIGPGQTCVGNQSVYCHVCHIQKLLGLPTKPPPPDALALALAARNDAWAALASIVRRCQYNCSRASYCGTCAVALQGLPENYDLDSPSSYSVHGV